MLKHFQAILLILCSFCGYADNIEEDKLISAVSDALVYLDDYTIDEDAENINLQLSNEAVGYINQFLETQNNIINSSTLYLRKIRAQALIKINFKRYYIQDGQIEAPNSNAAPLNEEEVKTALADIDLVLADTPDDTIARRAASAASVLINDDKRSNQYYDICADLKNPACMNIAGYYAFYGVKQAKQNPQRAIRLHTETYQTGTRAGCAGFYSAKQLSDIAYFTEFDTGDSWQNWLKKAYELYPALKKRFNKAVPCVGPMTVIQEYIMFLGDKQKKPELLTQALSFELNQEQKALVQALQNTTNLNQPVDYFYSAKPESKQCFTGQLLLMFAALSNDPKLVEIQSRNFQTLDRVHCEEQYYLVTQAKLIARKNE